MDNKTYNQMRFAECSAELERQKKIKNKLNQVEVQMEALKAELVSLREMVDKDYAKAEFALAEYSVPQSDLDD